MDAILFSARRGRVNVEDGRRFLEDPDHSELYWDLPHKVTSRKFSFPILGLIHIKGGKVQYQATIAKIIPGDPSYYEDATLISRTKPSEWQRGSPNWRSWSTLVITKIEPFSIEAMSLKRYDGIPAKRAPQGNYTRIIAPKPEDAGP